MLRCMIEIQLILYNPLWYLLHTVDIFRMGQEKSGAH